MYPKGSLGIIKEGVYADITLIDGNPIEDMLRLKNRDNISLIMKNGKIYKTAL